MTSIGDFLDSCGLGHYAEAFEAEEIDFGDVSDLREDDLRELGLTIGARRKFQRGVAQLSADGELNSADTQAERRHLTVLFCDLADSTAIAERLDPEEMSEILRRYQAVCTDAIGRFGGTIAKFMGDGLLAYFGYPVAHEDDAHRSVDAALAIVDAANSWPRLHDVDCVVRVGIATGVVVVGETIGSASSEEQVAVGGTLNLAARLEGIAGSNDIAIAESTRALIGDQFELADRGQHELKGFSHAQRVWSVRGRASRRRFQANHSDRRPMVGRASELARLRSIWQRVSNGSTVRVAVAGPSGLGKSRLVDELRRKEQPASELIVQCAEPYATTPYWPFTRWLSDRTGQGPPTVDDLVDRNGLSRDLAISVASLWSHDDHELPANPALVRERTLDGLAQLILSSFDSGPALLVAEDTHWADQSTLELLSRVADRAESPLLIAETTRDPRNERNATVIQLDRLDRNAVAELIDGLAPDLELADDMLRRIDERADGNPYFVEQFVDYARAADVDDSLADAIPATLQDALMARLDRSPRARDFLLAASVVGTAFDVGMVAAAVGVSPDLVRVALDDAIDDGLVVRFENRVDGFRFTQPLLCDTAYRSLVRERRTRYHLEVAREMIDRGRGRDRPELIARHLAAASDHEDALYYWERAAELAIGRSASAEAAAHLAAALEALGRATDIDDRDGRELRLQLLLGARQLALHGFAAVDVELVYSRALELCEQVDDGPERLSAFWGLWGFHVVRADLDEAEELAVGFAALAERLDHRPAIVAAGYARGVTAFYRGDLAGATDAFVGAIDRFDSADTEQCILQYGLDLAVSVTSYLAWIQALRGQVDEAKHTANEAIEIGLATRDPFSIAFARTFAAQTHLFIDELDEAAKLAKATKEMAFEYGYEQFQGQADIQLGHIAARYDRPIEIGPIRRGLDKYLSTGASLALPYTRAWLAEAHCARGELDIAAETIERGLQESMASGEHYFDAELLRLASMIAARRGDESSSIEFRNEALAVAQRQDAGLLIDRITDTASPPSTNTGVTA